jgi:copper(I)-binding protein
MNLLRSLSWLLLPAAAHLSCSGVALAQVAKVEGAWARPTVAGQSVGGGYLKIAGGANADRLLSASAPVAKQTELHTMSMDGDVMRMRPIDAVAVPPRQTVELKPGGQHLMFVGLAKPLKAGSTFPLTMRFEKAGDITVQVKVATQAP